MTTYNDGGASSVINSYLYNKRRLPVSEILFQRDERSSKRRQYIYLGGSLLAEHSRPLSGSTATITYQHTDALGTPVAITNSSRTVTERREYEPYGYQTTPALQDGPNYTGHVADAATGLVYMQQRYYDPMIPRFLSVDPVTAYDDPIGMFNRYRYANNNPYRFSDPDGRCTAASSATKETASTAICQDVKKLNLSGNGAKNITGFEGYRTTAYKVGSDKPTIGIGHTDGVKIGDKMTSEQVSSAFRRGRFECRRYGGKPSWQSSGFTAGI